LALGTITQPITLFCDVPGHRAAGMELSITPAASSEASASTAPADSAGGAATTGTGPDIDFTLTMPEGSTPRDPTAPAPSTGTLHELTLHATEQVLEVAPGVRREMWTFAGQVPGPFLRGNVGDTFRITLVNDGTLGHSIDFHASQVAADDEMRTIKPGEQLVYEFTAGSSGIFMYHCGTPPVLHHIGNGMYGAIIVDPPGLTPVDHEYVFLQSELYLSADEGPGDLSRMADEDWDAVMFNGYVNQYRDHPIRVEPHERIRMWVLNAGPSDISAFHVIGTIYDTVYKEGAYLLQPGSLAGGSQVLDLFPAQGGFVEFSLAEAGLYPIVTHKFSDAGKGALGLFQAGDVEISVGTGGHS
jgi:nitrite reductase (NO-forming)